MLTMCAQLFNTVEKEGKLKIENSNHLEKFFRVHNKQIIQMNFC